jgi:hypothetical protein
MKLTKTDNYIVEMDLGKVAYNSKRKINRCVVNVGFRYLEGNSESYFTVTGDIWNNIETDIVCCGCGVQETILTYFPNNGILKEICEYGKKYHLKKFTLIPEVERNKIIELLEII